MDIPAELKQHLEDTIPLMAQKLIASQPDTLSAAQMAIIVADALRESAQNIALKHFRDYLGVNGGYCLGERFALAPLGD